jgi:hypothetical protein
MSALQTRACIAGRVLAGVRYRLRAGPARGWRGSAAALLAAQAFGALTIALPSYAETGSFPVISAPGAGQSTTSVRHVDARSLSCQELKSGIRDAGALVIAAGPEGGDLFHARAPQCEFWQRAQSASIRAKDGWCAVGYVCVAKFGP